MLNLRSSSVPILIVAAVSVGAALFRVTTAPERVRDRRDLAQRTCVSLGGEWAVVNHAEVCRRPIGSSLWQ